MNTPIPHTDLQAIADALEAAGVFTSPLARLNPRWTEYHEDAARRLREAREVLAKHGVNPPSSN